MKKVGINGFGRIGRMVFRAWLENSNKSELSIVAVNNPLKKGQSMEHFIHMLKYDTVHGKLNAEIKVEKDGFLVNGHKVMFYDQLDPANIPWEEMQVNVVVDSTGVFKDKSGLSKHLHGSVKKVLMTAPGDGLDGTFVMGVNDDKYNKDLHHIVSNASCTTNCLAPLVKVLETEFGVEKGLITTCHAATNDQRVVDAEHEDLRRARSTFNNMIPTKTGAAKAVGEVLPTLKGKIDGISIRVPTLDVSVVDSTFILKKSVSSEEVNNAFETAARGFLKGVLDVSHEELVSSDYIGNSFSSIVDAKYTKVMDGNMVKVLSWYDNEWGYSCRVLDLIHKLF